MSYENIELDDMISDTSSTFEYISEFANNNVNQNLLPRSRNNSNHSSIDLEAQKITLDDDYEQYDVDEDEDKYQFRPISRRKIASMAGFAFLIWVITVIIYSRIPKASYLTQSSLKPVTLDDSRSGEFFFFQETLNFITPPSNMELEDEGLHYVVKNKTFIAKKLSDPDFSQNIISSRSTFNDDELKITQIYPNYNLDVIIVKTASRSQWRHSSFSNFYIYQNGTFTPLHKTGSEQISFVEWSPKFNYIAYVYSNNIYIKSLENNETITVTTDGNENIFNGKPDWVYEEEVVALDRFLWWSHDELNLLYIKTNDSQVPVYDVDRFTTKDDYPTHSYIKYPKSGSSNPILSVVNFNIASNQNKLLDVHDQGLGTDFIVYDCLWMNDNEILIKQSDRTSSVMHYNLFNYNENKVTTVRKIDAENQYGGWVDKSKSVVVSANPEFGRSEDGYVELYVDNNGFLHLAYFEKDSAEPNKVLTTGNYDDKDSFLQFDAMSNKIYYSTTKYSSMSSHLFSVDLETAETTPLVQNATELSYYEAKYSPSGKYASIIYKGPDIPKQYLVDLHNLEAKPLSVVDTKYLQDTLSQFAVPTKEFIEIDIGDGVVLNAKVTKPVGFLENRKYPLLVNYYGGPGSQRVESKFDVGFADAIVSSLDAVHILIDPRGTDSKGWEFKKYALKSIGQHEAQDIIAATSKYISNNKFIDSSKTAAWGWSYSGYVSLKIAEIDNDEVFKYVAAVAPVTDWSLYDSIYTERYMNLISENSEGYKVAKIGGSEFKFSNFKKHKERILLMHGTGDDNVHIQNTYKLLDDLNLNDAWQNVDLLVFPDSDHSIYHHNANSVVFGRLFNWFKDAFGGSLRRLTT